jgi:23S rRNA pseudoU1915 N3-methylase RlmH
LDLNLTAKKPEAFREDISEYVAQLQLHMALQARNLLPTLTDITDSRQQMLQETQAIIEKLASRQSL